MTNTLELTNKTKIKPPISGLIFKKMKDEVIGKNYNLSVVFIGNSLSKNLNFKYRKKNKPTNVLSFPLSKDSGEIFLNLPLIKKESDIWQSTYKDFLAYLYIHGLLHLKGFDHGPEMTKKEALFSRKFKIKIKALNQS